MAGERALEASRPSGGKDVSRDLILLGLLALAVLTAGLGLRDPWPPDEPRFALVATGMVESGDWLIPRVAGVLYPDKPPLFFWEIAAILVLTGNLRLAFLLPSLLAGLVALGLVYDLGRRLWGIRAGRLAALALLISVQFPLHVRSGQIDASETMWVILGIYGLSRHLLLGPSWGWYRAAFVAMGAGVITKGVGFLPLLILAPWWYARRRGWMGLPRIRGNWRHWSSGPALLLLTVAGSCRSSRRCSGPGIRRCKPTSTSFCSGRPPRATWGRGTTSSRSGTTWSRSFPCSGSL